MKCLFIILYVLFLFGCSNKVISMADLKKDIKDNDVYTNGKYAVDIRYKVNGANVTGNFLSANLLKGDEAVYIKSGNDIVVEDNYPTVAVVTNETFFKYFDDNWKDAETVLKPGTHEIPLPEERLSETKSRLSRANREFEEISAKIANADISDIVNNFFIRRNNRPGCKLVIIIVEPSPIEEFFKIVCKENHRSFKK